MNSFKRKQTENTYEVIVPLDGQEGVTALYDDCPICQELKQQMARGEITITEMDLGLATDDVSDE